MRKIFGVLLFLASLVGILAGCGRFFTPEAPPSATSSSEVAPFEFVEGKARVLIGFRGLPGPAEEALVRAAGGEVRWTYRIIPAIAATLPEPAIEALRRNPHVTVVEPDVTVYAWDYTAELNNTWGVKRIGAGTVHTGGNLGSEVKVAVIDTGIDYTHAELDAVYAGGYDFVNKDNDPWDDNGHGTHVAGTIAAARNGTGVVGAAPEVQLYALKVLGAGGSGKFSDVIKALEWCVQNGIQITNNSYGSKTDPGTLVQQAFDNAYRAGILHVAAAGNEGKPNGAGDTVGYPAKYDSVIAVAATNSSDLRASFSSTGPAVELAAPGVSINSTVPGGGYASWSGTSMASPHVAGTAALVWAANPGWTNGQVRQRLVETATDLGTTGRDPWYGYGLVNAASAAAPPPPSTGTIVVKKTVAGPAPATAWQFSGTSPIGAFELPATGGSRSLTVPSGAAYTITETTKPGYTCTYQVGSGPVQSGNSATVTPSPGEEITITFTNTAQTGTIVVKKTVVGQPPTSAWQFAGTGAIGSFTLPAGGGETTFSDLLVGTYTVTETPKDGYTVAYKVGDGVAQSGTSTTVSLTAGATVTVEFINTYTAPIPMWVSGIDMRLVVPNKNFTYATATVTVVDSTGPVAGATVTGRWSGATSATVSGTTDATGKVTFQSAQVRNFRGTTFTFCVTNVTKAGWTYDSNRNVETCDSVKVP